MTTSAAQTTPNNRVARCVKHLMLAHDEMSNQELAARLGWSESKVSRLLNEKVRWDLDELPEVAAVFGVHYTDLFGKPGQLVDRALTHEYVTRKSGPLSGNTRSSAPKSSHIMHSRRHGREAA